MKIYVTYAKDVIQCSKCGVRAEAELTSVAQWCYSMEEVERIVRSQAPKIPVGWSMNGRDDLRCNDCT